MPGDVFALPAEEFRASVLQLKGALSLLRAVRDFGSADVPAGAAWESATALRTEIRAQNVAAPILAGTLLLYLAGRFEHYVRAVFELTADGIAEKCTRYSDLPPKMREGLRYWTAETVLRPSRYGFDLVQVEGFVVTLAANIRAVDRLGPINSSCLSVTERNMTPGTMAELFKRIGVDALWSDISNQAAVRTLVTLDDARDAEREVKSRLESLMALRNQIAHPAGTPTWPDLEQVELYVTLVETVALTLTELCRVWRLSFRPEEGVADNREQG